MILTKFRVFFYFSGNTVRRSVSEIEPVKFEKLPKNENWIFVSKLPFILYPAWRSNFFVFEGNLVTVFLARNGTETEK